MPKAQPLSAGVGSTIVRLWWVVVLATLVGGVVAYAASFADGIHTSIPAPGIGALAAGIGRLAAQARGRWFRLQLFPAYAVFGYKQ